MVFNLVANNSLQYVDEFIQQHIAMKSDFIRRDGLAGVY